MNHAPDEVGLREGSTDPDATLDDLRGRGTLEDAERICAARARWRAPDPTGIEASLRKARCRARETPPRYKEATPPTTTLPILKPLGEHLRRHLFSFGLLPRELRVDALHEREGGLVLFIRLQDLFEVGLGLVEF